MVVCVCLLEWVLSLSIFYFLSFFLNFTHTFFLTVTSAPDLNNVEPSTLPAKSTSSHSFLGAPEMVKNPTHWSFQSTLTNA